MHTETWHVDLFLAESGKDTTARAVLHGSSAATQPVGTGRARRAAGDPSVPEIGQEVAAARALHALSHELLRLAEHDIEVLEDDHDVTIHMPQP